MTLNIVIQTVPSNTRLGFKLFVGNARNEENIKSRFVICNTISNNFCNAQHMKSSNPLFTNHEYTNWWTKYDLAANKFIAQLQDSYPWLAIKSIKLMPKYQIANILKWCERQLRIQYFASIEPIAPEMETGFFHFRWLIDKKKCGKCMYVMTQQQSRCNKLKFPLMMWRNIEHRIYI